MPAGYPQPPPDESALDWGPRPRCMEIALVFALAQVVWRSSRPRSAAGSIFVWSSRFAVRAGISA